MTTPHSDRSPRRMPSIVGSSLARRVSLAVVGVATMLVLASCGTAESRPLTTLSPRGEQAQEIHNLVKPVFWIAGVVFILVEFGILFVIFRFRRRKDDVDGEGEPVQLHGHTPLEIFWTALPALILAVLAVMNVQAIFKVDERKSDAIEIEVYGQQWWWEYRYDIDGDNQPDIITANQMVIPVDRPVELAIRSRDVIHSFWIPALNGKMDAVPGGSHFLAFQANETGVFQGQCTEFCGLSHGYMRMDVKAVDQADYDTWVQEQMAPPPEPDNAQAKAGRTTFTSQCAYCHQVDGLQADGSYTDAGPQADYQGLDGKTAPPLRSGEAPNLTHLMSREMFAGGMFPLYNEDGTPDRAALKEWLTDPPAMKPNNAGNQQGMPNLQLDPATIDDLVEYLVTLH